MTIDTRHVRYLATPDEPGGPQRASNLHGHGRELAGGGKPRRRVATICRVRNRDLAERIALDVNEDEAEDEAHAYVLGARKIAELQIIHPLVWSSGG
jgi:hypothetical protein